MTYRLKVNQQWKIVLAIILCPSFFVLVFIPTILQFKDLPDWAIFAASFALVGVSIAATLLVVTRWLTVDCEIRMDEAGFHFRLLRPTPFMHLHDFSCNWENIANVSLNEDPQHDRVFYAVRFHKPGMSLYFSESPETATAFWETLNGYVDAYNASTRDPELRIKDIGFYETAWAKVLTGLTLIFSGILLFTMLLYPGRINGWRAVAFFCMAIPWILNFYYAKRKRENHT